MHSNPAAAAIAVWSVAAACCCAAAGAPAGGCPAASWARHSIDAELAALTYDSARDAEPAVAQSRTEPASLRALTFACAGLELAVTGDGPVGQLVPPQPGDVEVDVAGAAGPPCRSTRSAAS